MDLVEFLNARLDEREQMARSMNLGGTGFTLSVVGGPTVYTAERALADVESKRRIVELHTGDHECSTYDHNGEIDHCTWVIGDCSTLQLLALPDADHTDYQAEWKP